MLTGVPFLTISPAVGIWLSIGSLGSACGGEDCPSVRSFSRRILSASARLFFVMSGTVIFPLPTASSTTTGVCFLTFSPAGGVCLSTLPRAALSSTTVFWLGSSLRLALVSFSSAANADFCPTTFGTTTSCGANSL